MYDDLRKKKEYRSDFIKNYFNYLVQSPDQFHAVQKVLEQRTGRTMSNSELETKINEEACSIYKQLEVYGRYQVYDFRDAIN